MNKKYVIYVNDFDSAFDICSILSVQENIDIKVNAAFHPDKFGQGYIEYTIIYSYSEV